MLSLSRYQGVIAKEQLADRSGQAESLIGFKIVEPNQLVINKMQAANGLIAVSKVDGIISSEYSIYTTDNKNLIISEFICHSLKQPEFQEEINRRVTGVMDGFIRLYTADLFEIAIILPPLSVQKEIVDFLDEKTAQIDQAIEIKEKQIALLQERKQLLIQNAVTRGLNPNTPMKDSGVDWIGQIPAHWDVRPLRALFQFRN